MRWNLILPSGFCGSSEISISGYRQDQGNLAEERNKGNATVEIVIQEELYTMGYVCIVGGLP